MNAWHPKPPPFVDFKKKVFQTEARIAEFIYQIGEYPALRKPSRKISVSKIKTEEMRLKFAYLQDCLKKYREISGHGRGITAVQVGIPERFSVIYHPKGSFIIINPKITARSKKKLLYPEMCMSVSPVIAPTVLPSWIAFEYLDTQGNKKIWDKKDTNANDRMMNRVFQHEINHMEGIINIDLCFSHELILHSDPSFYESADFTEV